MGMYTLDVNCVEDKVASILKAYPSSLKDLQTALDVSAKLKQGHAKHLLNPDDLLKKFAVQV
jgi:hypothetical protein